MRSYSLPALILGTVGTGLLSAFLLFTVLASVPSRIGIDTRPAHSEMSWVNQQLEAGFWYWSVVVVAAKAILIAAGAMLCRIRLRHHLTYKFATTIGIAAAVQLGLHLLGFDFFITALAQAQSSAGPVLSQAGWQSSDQDRLCLAGIALVSFIYAIALSLQVGHDHRGTRCA